MEILSTFVGKVLDFTVVPVGRQLGYVLCYSDNIKGLQKEAEKLNAARTDMEREVAASRRNNERIKETVELWMRHADAITAKGEKFFEQESRANTGCSLRSCPNLWLRYKLSRKAKKMTKEVDKLNGSEVVKFDKVSIPQTPPQGIRPVVRETIESRVSTMEEIMKALADPAVHLIGLYGLGGVGKTTLAKQVANKAQGKLFDKVIFVEVRSKYSIKEIQSQIADMVGLKFRMQSESNVLRANKLHSTLEQEKSLLIVLDDLWERLNFGEVGIPFAGDTNRKFILTSRDENLLYRQMDCEKIIKVELLSEEEAWRLFKEKAEISEDSDDRELVSIAKEVSCKCAELPIAIVTVASALRKKKIPGAWRDALRQLRSYSSPNSSIRKEVYSSIKLSYDYLEDDELKYTFLLSAMFSQDPFIMDLFMYAFGLDYLKSVSHMDEARDMLDERVRQLKASSLLLDSSSEDRFTIHDVVRDVALSIAFEEHYALVKRCETVDEWPDEYQPESCTAICLDESDIDGLPEELKGPKVKFFYLESKDTELKMPSNFFNEMQELQVLSLSNMTFSPLPSSISHLKELVTLALRSCTLEDITVVKYLKKLKILDLSHSVIKQLPYEVGQLSFLKILNLSGCRQLEVIPPNILSNLRRLEELYMEDSFNRWEAEGLNGGKERASLDELKHLQKLSVLEIDIFDVSVLPKDLFLNNSLQRYKISIGWSHYYYDYEFSRTFRLVANNNINMKYGVFRLFENVEDLVLEKLNCIASLYQSHITAQTFCKLRAIKLSRCDQLKYLFSVSMVGRLSQLKKIEVSECKSLEEIVTFRDEENVQKGSVRNVVEFPQLRFLELNDLPMLTDICFKKVAFPRLETLDLVSLNWQNIWDIPTSESSGTQISEIVESSQTRIMSNNPLADGSFGNLKILTVTNCDFVLKLIPFHILESLINLEELVIMNCDSLEVVFDSGEFNNYKETYAFRLKKISLISLPKLNTVWSRGILGIFSFQDLQMVSVSSCESLKSIFPTSIAKGLNQLEELEISDCGTEVVVAKDEFPLEADATLVFSKLRKLAIYNCKDLKIFESELSDTKYSLFLHEKVIPKLEELSLSGRQATMMCYGEFQAYHFLNAKFLSLWKVYGKAETLPTGFPKLQMSSSPFKVIFSGPKRSLDNDAPKVTPIESLEFSSMNLLKRIWDGKCQGDYILQNLKSLRVSRCHRLRSLGPSFVSLENLIELDVSFCDELINLLTPKTARTLMQLRTLTITRCKKIEEIITKEQEGVEKEIHFMKLKKLKLQELASCKSFCCHDYSFKFPSLDEVIITGCPRLRMLCPGELTTPLLMGVKVEDDEMWWEGNLSKTEMCWEGNLNKTLEQLFDEKVMFRGVDVKFDEYPELMNIWNGKCAVSDGSLSNLTSLIMDKCDSLSYQVIPFHILTSLINLERLEVRNCGSVEVVFDLEGIDIDKEAHTLQAICMRMLRLDHLRNLKYVWNKDPHTIHCFQHLSSMRAYECENLRSIFPASIAKGLTNLLNLEIESCGVEVIVAEDPTPAPTTHFLFPSLYRLSLTNLSNLKNFYPQRHTIECPQLLDMDVRQCKKVKVFSWKDPKIAEKEAEDGVENQYPLFLFEKIVPMLRRLVLNQDHVKIISNGQFQDHLFDKVEGLVLDSFDEGVS